MRYKFLFTALLSFWALSHSVVQADIYNSEKVRVSAEVKTQYLYEDNRSLGQDSNDDTNSVSIEGRIKTRQWEGQDGNKRYSTEIHVTDMTFLTTKKDLQSSQAPVNPPKVEEDTASKAEEPAENDDLPF